MRIPSLGTGYRFWRAGDPRWQTRLFTTLTLSRMAHGMANRSEHNFLLETGVWSNRPLPGAVALAAGLSLVIFAAVDPERWIGRRAR